MIEVEICINSESEQDVASSVSSAYSAGASRIELCGGMNVGGLTPKKDHIIEAREAFKERSGLLVMIRPRSGNFIYFQKETDLMIRQIHSAAEAGADGIVLGVLKPEDNTPNTKLMSKFISICSQNSLPVTFHRAFDAAPNPFEALESLIQIGVQRVLTSGIPWGKKGTAMDGIDNLKRVIELSEGRIEIVVGGGINIKNAVQILSRLPVSGNKISVHSYSGVQEKGFTKEQAVKSLVNEVRKIDPNN